MSRNAALITHRVVPRAVRSSNAIRIFSPTVCRAPKTLLRPSIPLRRAFSACPSRSKGIMPDTDQPSQEAEKMETTCTAVEVSEDEYHEIADIYLESVLVKFEELQDARDDIDIDYSAGVMTITMMHKGTYVINKQPPNKQIWLSSPISGPKRYDWCVFGESQGDKEGTGSGEWVYMRDGSSLSGLILKELGVDIRASLES